MIYFDRRGGVLFYRGASGKTVDHIRLSQGDHTVFLVVAFTDRTEWSVTLNSMPVATDSLYAPGDGDLSDLEPIAESGYILLPETRPYSMEPNQAAAQTTEGPQASRIESSIDWRGRRPNLNRSARPPGGNQHQRGAILAHCASTYGSPTSLWGRSQL